MGRDIYTEAEGFEYSITITVNDDGTLGYEQDTVLQIAGRAEPFHHVEKNLLRRIAGPQPNPAVCAGAAKRPR